MKAFKDAVNRNVKASYVHFSPFTENDLGGDVYRPLATYRLYVLAAGVWLIFRVA